MIVKFRIQVDSTLAAMTERAKKIFDNYFNEMARTGSLLSAREKGHPFFTCVSMCVCV